MKCWPGMSRAQLYFSFGLVFRDSLALGSPPDLEFTIYSSLASKPRATLLAQTGAKVLELQVCTPHARHQVPLKDHKPTGRKLWYISLSTTLTGSPLPHSTAGVSGRYSD